MRSATRTGRAVADDGVQLAWTLDGPESSADGAPGTAGELPVIVCCNGVGVSTFFWKYLVAHYAGRARVLSWDYRGHGDSERPADPYAIELSIPRLARDLIAVMDDAGVDRAMLVGHSMGCQVIFEAYHQWPERVTALVPMLGTAGRTLDTFADNPRSPVMFRAIAHMVDRAGDRVNRLTGPLLNSPVAWWFTRTAALVDPFYAAKDDMLPYLQHLATLDMRFFMRLVLATNDHDAWPTLPDVKVPTLVIAAERDTFTPIRLSRKMVRDIPGAELLVLADGSHAAIIEQPDTIVHRMDRFVRERGVFA
jgi:pimeloyl-ACP methyl ester carboxylesterase